MNSSQIQVLKDTIAKKASVDELQFFMMVCTRSGLDPFTRQIFPVFRWDKKESREVMTIQVSVDGYRVIAHKTGEFGGIDKPTFDEGLSLYEHKQTGRKRPETCEITVYRIVNGNRCPVTVEICWDDFYPGEKMGYMWTSKPYQMMAKTAESQALRKAFQIELNGIEPEQPYTDRPSRPEALRSYDWAESQQAIRNAPDLQSVKSIAEKVKVRLPELPEYEIDRAVTIASERLITQSPTPGSRVSKTMKDLGLTKEQVRILADELGIADAKNMTEDEADALIIRMGSSVQTIDTNF